jgi:CubicO group peptidase (beta-lactamase class C family)
VERQAFSSSVGTDSIDGDTIWRVGSVSKMMPALAALQRAEVDMEASVLEYLPELAENEGEGVNAVRWRDVTVRSLANHLAGLATDCESQSILLLRR